MYMVRVKKSIMQHKLQHINATGQDYVDQLGGCIFVNLCDSVCLFQMRKPVFLHIFCN